MNTVHIKHSIGVVLTGIFAITVIACAEYNVREKGEVEYIDASAVESKVPEQNNSPTAQQYSGAEAAAVIAQAKMAFKRAEELGGLWRDTTKLLKKANVALKKNDNDKAYEVASIAKSQAELALNQSYLEKANHMIGRVKKMAKRDDMKMLGRVSDAEAAYLSDNGEKAYALSMAMLEQLGYSDRAKPVNVAAAVARKSRPKPIKPAQEKPILFDSLPDVVDQDHDVEMEKEIEMQMNSDPAPSALNVSETSSNKMDLDDKYKVKPGDSLWIISSLPAVYSNPYQWPLIYKTNKKTIRDPDLIRPGQVLNIDREASEVEINDAITHAKSRGAWSLEEREVFDRAYLSDSDIVTH